MSVPYNEKTIRETIGNTGPVFPVVSLLVLPSLLVLMKELILEL